VTGGSLPFRGPVGDHAPVRLLAVRLLAVRLLAAFSALTWLVFPGFGLIDLSVTWDPDWPVVLEASWGVFMTVLVGGSLLAVAVRPRRPAPAAVTLLVALLAMLVSVVLGLEAPLLGYVAVLVVQALTLAALLCGVSGREPLHPLVWSVRRPLLVVAALGVVPWLVHAERMYRGNRGNAGVVIGDVTMGVDHYAVQGALALSLVVLALLAAIWPRGRRHLGVSVGLCAGYLGVVSYAFPATWAGFDAGWSVLCVAWAAAVALGSLLPPLERRELRGEVVEAQRPL
jgi:hypothetical protein